MSYKLPLTATIAAAALTAGAAPAVAAPSNDNFEQATPITAPATVTGTFTDVTRQAGEPAHAGRADLRSAWYVFRPTRTERVDAGFTTETRYGPHVVAVYTGSALSDLQPVAASEPVFSDVFPRVAFDAVAGRTYWIAAATAQIPELPQPEVPFNLRVRPAPLPINDAFAGARNVRVPGIYTGSMLDATAELGEPGHAGRPASRSLWYRFRARHAARHTIDVTGSAGGAGAGVEVYTGEELASLRRVGSHTGAGIVRFTARRGQLYHVAVDATYVRNGDVVLDVSDGSLAAKGVTVAVRTGQTVASIRARGLRLDVGTRRQVSVRLELVVTERTARRLGLRGTVLGRTRGTLEPGQRLAADIPLTSAVRRALRGEQELSATVKVSLLSNAPNREKAIRVDLPN